MGQPKDQPAYAVQLVENMMIVCKDGKLIIPNDLQDTAVAWYHHYLQHTDSTCLKENLIECDVLEWYVTYHLITHQKVSQLPD
jgi:hypothetical protein